MKAEYNNSIILGKDKSGKTYEASGYQHILLIAPHGSGKGVVYVLPTLLSLEESCIVHDIKLENYQLTSNYRKSIGHKIFIFAPTDERFKTHKYNPLDFIGNSYQEKINNIQKIANLLINGSEASKILFIAIVLYLDVINGVRTIGEVARMVNRNLEVELNNNLTKINKSNNAFCFDAISGFLSYSKEQKDKITDELKTALYLWTNNYIDYATSESDFDIAGIKTSKTTIYVGLNPDEIVMMKPLMRLFYNHAFERLMRASILLREKNTEKNHDKESGVTIIMDDFHDLGKLENYAFGYLRGYKVRLFSIASSISSIEDVYGENQMLNIISDSAFKVFFSANDFKTAKHISSLCIDKKEHREFMNWQEIINLPQDTQIVLMNNEQPLVLKKMRYHEDEEIKKELLLLRLGLSKTYNYAKNRI